MGILGRFARALLPLPVNGICPGDLLAEEAEDIVRLVRPEARFSHENANVFHVVLREVEGGVLLVFRWSQGEAEQDACDDNRGSEKVK